MNSLAITSFLLAIAGATSLQAQHNASFVRLPSEWLYLLPQPFKSNLDYGWLNSTTTGNSTINDLLAQANQSHIVSYSDEYDAIVGSNPTWSTIQTPLGDPYGAFEGGAWIPETDEVWFAYSGFVYPFNQTITSFSLQNGTSRQIVTDPPIRYPYGMYYWPSDGLVYVSEFSLPTDPAAVITIDPKTLKVTPICNSYQGLALTPVDDIVVTRTNNRNYIFMTSLSIHHNIPKVPKQIYDTAVWRFSLSDNTLLPVIDSNQILAPNGIRASADGRKLYVTNTPLINFDTLEEQAQQTPKSNSIYVYDLTDDGFPVNGRLFGLVRTGIANGLHIDNAGRVWTAEDDGIIVRSPAGSTLGSFNYIPFHPIDSPVIANFALAGNRLVIGVNDFVQIYNLAETLTTPGNSLTN